MAKCPHCGKEVPYVPKLTPELRLRVRWLAEEIVGHRREIGGEMDGRTFRDLTFDAARAASLQCSHFIGARRYLLGVGAVRHPDEKAENRTRHGKGLLWIVDWGKMRQLAEAGFAQ
ncbi:MAG: hypothetical protein ACLP1Y_09030 [Candidatus Acidiferrales bacterium]